MSALHMHGNIKIAQYVDNTANYNTHKNGTYKHQKDISIQKQNLYLFLQMEIKTKD